MSRFLDVRHETLKPYTPGEQPKKRSFIKLNTNENPYPPSPKVLAAINSEELLDLRLYSDTGASALVQAIAENYGLSEDQVFTGNGSDEVLAFSFMAFCGKKGIMFPNISYGFYRVYADLFKVRSQEIPLRDDFSIDTDPYCRPGSNVVIANPNAPTGLALATDQIERIVRAHPDDVVIIDEAYVDFGAESCVPLIDRFENLLIIQTFSKSRSLAGGRIGFAMGNSGLIADLNRIKFSFHPYNLGRLPILAGTAAMRDTEYFRSCVGRIVDVRDRTAAALQAMGCAVTESKANFLFVRLPGIPGLTAQTKLRDRGILVRRFDEPAIRDWLRVSIGTDEDMQFFLRTVECILKGE